MPTEDELKAMTYIVSSLRIVPHSSEVFEIHSTNLTCLSGSNSSTMKCTEKIKDETSNGIVGDADAMHGRIWDLTLAAAAPPSLSSLPARLKTSEQQQSSRTRMLLLQSACASRESE
ncbi:hypothetical protein BASA82_000952 [Batrachochytrium salamandrivorans]|nr:hypothetical protein BASA82_000952 [Batrachochytrium salamandrivorans]